MSDIAIRVENISKRYTIGKTSNGSLRETIAGLFSKNGSDTTEEFYALRDVSFEVKRGEAIGIIGKNGAGKSTLLKILSRITEPTSGRIEIDGRVSSLLEVGTGFHPELTGRENVFLNGTILGMSRAEVKRKFDEIVDFSGVEKFLDTPVKRYSSGMTVRLAFAVAAHLEPEILIIDEVLAVGDAEFQKKCLGKMEDVAGEGRTVIFVSHNMAAVSHLCKMGVYLRNATVETIGEIDHVVKHYLHRNENAARIPLAKRRDRSGSQIVRFNSVDFFSADSNKLTTLMSGQHCILRLSMECTQSVVENVNELKVAVGIDDLKDQRISHLNNEATNQVFTDVHKLDSIDVIIPKLPLQPGTYSLTLFCEVDKEISDWIQNAFYFEVESGDFFYTGKLPPEGQGIFFIDHEFRLSESFVH